MSWHQAPLWGWRASDAAVPAPASPQATILCQEHTLGPFRPACPIGPLRKVNFLWQQATAKGLVGNMTQGGGHSWSRGAVPQKPGTLVEFVQMHGGVSAPGRLWQEGKPELRGQGAFPRAAGCRLAPSCMATMEMEMTWGPSCWLGWLCGAHPLGQM